LSMSMCLQAQWRFCHSRSPPPCCGHHMPAFHRYLHASDEAMTLPVSLCSHILAHFHALFLLVHIEQPRCYSRISFLTTSSAFNSTRYTCREWTTIPWTPWARRRATRLTWRPLPESLPSWPSEDSTPSASPCLFSSQSLSHAVSIFIFSMRKFAASCCTSCSHAYMKIVFSPISVQISLQIFNVLPMRTENRMFGYRKNSHFYTFLF
jgi:hypothetical protein